LGAGGWVELGEDAADAGEDDARGLCDCGACEWGELGAMWTNATDAAWLRSSDIAAILRPLTRVPEGRFELAARRDNDI